MKVKPKILLSILLVLFCFGVVSPGFAAPSEQAQFASPKLLVNTSFLNIRTGPGVQYSVLMTVVGGTELPVIGRSKDNVWYQVSTVVGVGWVNVEFTARRGSFDNVPVVTLADIIAGLNEPTADTLGLSGQGGGTVEGVTNSVTSPVLGNSIRFVLDNGRPITVRPGERFRAFIRVEAVNLRTQPAENAEAIGTLFRDDSADYTVVGSSTDKNGTPWVALDVADVGIGWVEGSKLSMRLSRVSGDVIVIIANSIAMRSAPGGSGDNLPVLNEGQEGYVANISGDGKFILFELGDGTRGWVPFDATKGRTGTPTDLIDLSLVPTGIAGTGSDTTSSTNQTQFGLDIPHIVINTGFLNLRSGPGAQFSIVDTLPGGTELPVLGIASDGVWFLVESSLGQGWVNIDFVVFRGSINAVPVINTR
ncbi:MAG: SH3 domain-containing protein [Anaerolineae bacterium]